MVGMFTLLLVENLGDHAPLRDRLEKRYSWSTRSTQTAFARHRRTGRSAPTSTRT
jgi:hypothetical protein